MGDQLKTLITGATGRQGGAVVRALLARGHEVVGLTRHPDADKARKLLDLGAGIVAGSFDDHDSLVSAMAGMDAIFAMSTPLEVGASVEVVKGIGLAEAAEEAEVGHIVYSSIASADRNTCIPHFEGKYRIEQHVRTLEIPYTILAPAYFYEHVLRPEVVPELKNGRIPWEQRPKKLLQMVSLRCYADFVVHVMENPERFNGRRIEIAADSITGLRIAKALSDFSGHTIEYVRVPRETILRAKKDLSLQYEWLSMSGFNVDIPRLKAEYPEITWEDFREWASEQDWSFLDDD